MRFTASGRTAALLVLLFCRVTLFWLVVSLKA